MNHLEILFKIFLKLLAESAGLLPSDPPIKRVLSRMGIFSRFDKCLSLGLESQFWILDMLFGLVPEPPGVLNFLRSF